MGKYYLLTDSLPGFFFGKEEKIELSGYFRYVEPIPPLPGEGISSTTKHLDSSSFVISFPNIDDKSRRFILQIRKQLFDGRAVRFPKLSVEVVSPDRSHKFIDFFDILADELIDGAVNDYGRIVYHDSITIKLRAERAFTITVGPILFSYP